MAETYEVGRSPRPPLELTAGGRRLVLGESAWLMGVVNATPDSFSDAGRYPTLVSRVARAGQLIAAGARIVDVGGESATTNRPPVPVAEEIERVVPLIERIVDEHGGGGGVAVSIETYKPAVAAAAIAAGACLVNDVSGLRDPELADVCAATGAGLILMHTRAAPKQRLHDPALYPDILGEVLAFLVARIELACSRGVSFEQLIVDPGPDFAKTPAQTIELLRGARRLHELGRPVLMAVSRKDFVGAVTARRPAERLAGSLAALAHGLDVGAHIFRMHDVAAAADFIAVRAALRGERELAVDAVLADELRWQPPA
jgi:dihydropteroate synthase